MASYLENYQDKYASFEHLITDTEKDVYKQMQSIFEKGDCIILDNPSTFMEGVLHAYANNHNSLCYCQPINKKHANSSYIVCIINKENPTIRVPQKYCRLSNRKEELEDKIDKRR